ncbi:N-acetyl-gamma-glutamyl-phosphate reductase [Geothrix sp. PMB-07]|uniref:N-acetyl-gamma-glutamyl-phosphate reductase n=1 Tax=Geothrix sp. PMB-07 TaxID=3068640 RepID=UPI0027428387|nr:N-acetyl-gamma-glutamyl-phosphate reductase [Geothrix sp. PMB-07]WLT31439.1 N-acetyl-gamma-glutamyl-phosphate reductase [Geothrix sp. PMB-07]
MKSVDVLILGASGYGGGELLRWLSNHPAINSIRGTARSHAGKPFHAQHPNLRGLIEGTFEAAPDWVALSQSEAPVVFSALPHGELGKLRPEFEAAWQAHGLIDRLTIIDLSADFRLDPTWVYGLVDWKPERMKGARRIANPGCFATALQLALLPLAEWKPAFVAVTAATGSSGSGAAPLDTAHHPTRANDFRAYKMLSHQHEAEVLRTLATAGWEAPLSFVPQSAPMVRGIFATLQFPLPAGIGEEALRAHFEAFYRDRFFVRMVEGSPRVAATTGSAFADLSVVARQGHGAVLVALDNLGKGMAAQAVQNLNLALGLPEWTGLKNAGGYPA